jgi:hypothetical protein
MAKDRPRSRRRRSRARVLAADDRERRHLRLVTDDWLKDLGGQAGLRPRLRLLAGRRRPIASAGTEAAPHAGPSPSGVA